MPKNVTTLRELGESASWLLVQQALGITDPKMQSDFMVDKVALLLFTRHSLPERMCTTAAVRQMGGTTIYSANPGGDWKAEVDSFQEQLIPIFGYYLDCMYIYGFPVDNWDTADSELRFPIINAGSPDAHPAHVLADIACMLRVKHELEGVEAAWMGCINGTLFSLLEAMAWFPFSLRICLPPQIDPTPVKERIARLKTKVTFASSPEEAVEGVDFVYAGCRAGLSDLELAPWTIDEKLMSKADRGARLMLSASPVRAIPIAPQIMSSGVSLLVRQAEFRLRIHKRILHWVFV